MLCDLSLSFLYQHDKEAFAAQLIVPYLLWTAGIIPLKLLYLILSGQAMQV